MTRATTKSAGLAGGKENGNSGHIDRPAQTAQAIPPLTRPSGTIADVLMDRVCLHLRKQVPENFGGMTIEQISLVFNELRSEIRRLCSDELHGEEDSAPRRDEARRHQRRRVDQGEAPVGESFRREGRTLPKARFHRQRDHGQFALAGRHAQFAAANETTSMHKMSRAPQVFRDLHGDEKFGKAVAHKVAVWLGAPPGIFDKIVNARLKTRLATFVEGLAL